MHMNMIINTAIIKILNKCDVIAVYWFKSHNCKMRVISNLKPCTELLFTNVGYTALYT